MKKDEGEGAWSRGGCDSHLHLVEDAGLARVVEAQHAHALLGFARACVLAPRIFGAERQMGQLRHFNQTTS